MTADIKDKPAFQCHARRHMSGAVYKTYDAMLAMAKSGKKNRQPGDPPLEFFAAIRPTLANHTNTGLSQIYEHIDQLLETGWLLEPDKDKPRERWEKGRLAPVRYYILEHFDYVENRVGECPPYKFQQSDDSETGIERGERIAGKGEQPADFALNTLSETPVGRVALVLQRATGKLPGNNWPEIAANARANPGNLPRIVTKPKKKRGSK
ncbi:MAG TPA: hypothetical protein VGT24_06285 [Candidatus Acidoferrales bacterium]|nr:hypothetical protein [Candidatus Acidoferrales bacterium]